MVISKIHDKFELKIKGKWCAWPLSNMATTTPSLLNHFSISFFLILSIFTPQALSQSNNECTTASSSSCNDKAAALPLKIIAIVTILITSLIGVSAPLFTRSVKALHPDRNLFVVVKSFAAGIILATGFMHVLPDSFDMLSSSCLEDNPWHKFPFTGFVAMLSAIVTLMVDSLATSIYSQKCNTGGGVLIPEGERDEELAAAPPSFGHMHGHSHHLDQTKDSRECWFPADAVLELGIVVHSIVIGLSLGASNNTYSIKGLIAALCFHQMFEGMGLGGCILQAEYKLFKKMVMVFFLP
ncbi:hypothetical protein Patl1_11794 [Pistacia atlantica]|uniref:Uncharacterized protein n=1 Tax=Pistacia atlantica TaxID=434234 RepID=A0ACC1A499_9ROSI|nr:hypothetical protein Patl1_11794 [Pistacia atlantica]